MVGCVTCPSRRRCPPDCIYKQVLPAYPSSVLEETRKKYIKIKLYSNREYFRKIYAEVYAKGGVEAAKALVDSWVMEYDARKQNPNLGLVGLIEKNKTKIESLEKQLEMYENRYGPLQEEDVAPSAAGLMGGLKKCTASLPATSSLD